MSPNPPATKKRKGDPELLLACKWAHKYLNQGAGADHLLRILKYLGARHTATKAQVAMLTSRLEAVQADLAELDACRKLLQEKDAQIQKMQRAADSMKTKTFRNIGNKKPKPVDLTALRAKIPEGAKTIYQMATEIGISPNTVVQRLKKHGIRYEIIVANLAYYKVSDFDKINYPWTHPTQRRHGQ